MKTCGDCPWQDDEGTCQVVGRRTGRAIECTPRRARLREERDKFRSLYWRAIDPHLFDLTLEEAK